MIKVSVIIPVYNVEQYLDACLNSVKTQTLSEIEIICINDASTDNSLEILRRYVSDDIRFKMFDLPLNRGLSFARNRGLEAAQGRYVYFLDSDDLIVPEALEILFDAAESEHLDVIYFDAEHIFENEEYRKRRVGGANERHNVYPGVYTGAMLFSEFIKFGDYVSMVQRQFYRKRYLEKNKLRFYEGIVHEDELFTFQAILNASRVMCFKDKLYIYRLREQSIMTKKVQAANAIGIFICLTEMLCFWKGREFGSAANQAIQVKISQIVRACKNKYRFLDDQEKAKINFQDAAVRFLFEQMVIEKENLDIGENKAIEILERTQENSKIIIYGAGTIAKECLKLLDRYQIEAIGFAVTDKKNNPGSIMGLHVYEIGELVKLKDESLVIVAVSAKLKDSVLEELNIRGFKRILTIS